MEPGEVVGSARAASNTGLRQIRDSGVCREATETVDGLGPTDRLPEGGLSASVGASFGLAPSCAGHKQLYQPKAGRRVSASLVP